MKFLLFSALLVGAALAPAVVGAQSASARTTLPAPTHTTPMRRGNGRSAAVPTRTPAPTAPTPTPSMEPYVPTGPAVGTPIAETAVAPPAPLREAQPPAPEQGHAVWIPGFWIWERTGFVWRSGHWEEPPREGMTWVAPRWEARDRGWTLGAGGWRMAPPPPPPFVAQPRAAPATEAPVAHSHH